MNHSYLTHLILRSNRGADRLPTARRRKWTQYVLSMRDDGGGFIGRDGDVDFSGTMFGLRALFMLKALDEKQAEKTADWLQKALLLLQKGDKRVVTERKNPTGLLATDLYALTFAAGLIESVCSREIFAEAGLDRGDFLLSGFQALRRGNGGVSSSIQVRHTSTYCTFITLCCLQLAGLSLNKFDPDYFSLLSKFVRNRQQPGGGFIELELIPTIGTVATNAAIGVADMIMAEWNRSLDENKQTNLNSDQITGVDAIYNVANAHSFLTRMHAPNGGYRAINRIPHATILSTYQAILGIGTLSNWRPNSFGNVRPTLNFVDSLYHSSGGFVSASWDTQPDLESTFYALSIMSLLSE